MQCRPLWINPHTSNVSAQPPSQFLLKSLYQPDEAWLGRERCLFGWEIAGEQGLKWATFHVTNIAGNGAVRHRNTPERRGKVNETRNKKIFWKEVTHETGTTPNRRKALGASSTLHLASLIWHLGCEQNVESDIRWPTVLIAIIYRFCCTDLHESWCYNS